MSNNTALKTDVRNIKFQNIWFYLIEQESAAFPANLGFREVRNTILNFANRKLELLYSRYRISENLKQEYRCGFMDLKEAAEFEIVRDAKLSEFVSGTSRRPLDTYTTTSEATIWFTDVMGNEEVRAARNVSDLRDFIYKWVRDVHEAKLRQQALQAQQDQVGIVQQSRQSSV